MKEEFQGELIKMISPLKESETHDWVKALAQIKWGDNPPSIDIRNMNLSNGRLGKGICLTDEETNKLCNVLLENDYGDIEVIEEALRKKKARITTEG